MKKHFSSFNSSELFAMQFIHVVPIHTSVIKMINGEPTIRIKTMYRTQSHTIYISGRCSNNDID